jgi:hypothetical protein
LLLLRMVKLLLRLLSLLRLLRRCTNWCRSISLTIVTRKICFSQFSSINLSFYLLCLSLCLLLLLSHLLLQPFNFTIFPLTCSILLLKLLRQVSFMLLLLSIMLLHLILKHNLLLFHPFNFLSGFFCFFLELNYLFLILF